MFSAEDIRMVAPALESYTQDHLLGDSWKRPGLSPRDRGIVTLAVLIARNQTMDMPYYLGIALENGVKPREISEVITHLAFYSGRENAMSALEAATRVFAQRGITADELPAASPTTSSAQRGRRSATRRAAIRRRGARRSAVHRQCLVPRSVASSRPRAAR